MNHASELRFDLSTRGSMDRKYRLRQTVAVWGTFLFFIFLGCLVIYWVQVHQSLAGRTELLDVGGGTHNHRTRIRLVFLVGLTVRHRGNSGSRRSDLNSRPRYYDARELE